MSQPLTIVAVFQAQPGREEDLSDALQMLIAPTRAEAGCINYDLHRDLQSPGRFLFYENWETREHWDAHMQSEHLRKHKNIADSLVAELEILQMEPMI